MVNVFIQSPFLHAIEVTTAAAFGISMFRACKIALHWSWLNKVHSNSDVKKCSTDAKSQDISAAAYGDTVTEMTFDLTNPLAMSAA